MYHPDHDLGGIFEAELIEAEILRAEIADVAKFVHSRENEPGRYTIRYSQALNEIETQEQFDSFFRYSAFLFAKGPHPVGAEDLLDAFASRAAGIHNSEEAWGDLSNDMLLDLDRWFGLIKFTAEREGYQKVLSRMRQITIRTAVVDRYL